MKKVAFAALFAFLCAGLCFAQGLSVEKVAGERSIAKDAYGNTIQQPRYGASIWNNQAVTAWWSGVDTDYINLDWGILSDAGNNLPDEVIDGFVFKYATNNLDAAGEDFEIYYFDSTTGFGNTGIQEAGFLFTALPNAATFGTLPPNYGWIVTVTVDIEGTGYEFLLGQQIGNAYVRASTPASGSTGIAIGAPGLAGGNSLTGTEDAFDTYYPNGLYENTWFFGGGYPANPWATFPGELFGAQDPAVNMQTGGIGAQGNDSGLYGIGSWTGGNSVDFLLRNGDQATAGLPGWLLASLNLNIQYYPAPVDVTLFLRLPFAAQFQMAPDGIGDFFRYTQNVGAGIAGLRVYFQGAITAFGPIAPADLSNPYASN